MKLSGEHLQGMKEWFVALIVPLMFVAAWWSVTAVNDQNDLNRLRVVCAIEQQNIVQLKALHQIARELGLPFGREEVPVQNPACEETP